MQCPECKTTMHKMVGVYGRNYIGATRGQKAKVISNEDATMRVCTNDNCSRHTRIENRCKLHGWWDAEDGKGECPQCREARLLYEQTMKGGRHEPDNYA